MFTLLPQDPLIVRYEGERDAEGPLTIGQLNILRWLDDLPSEAGWEKGALDLPEGARLSDVAAAFATLIARHEGLRTTYLAGQEPVQRVRKSGCLTVHLHELVQEHDLAAVPVEQLTWKLRQCLDARQPQDQREVALRVALATRGDVVLAGFVYYSHLAVDYFAVALLNREFAAMVRDPSAREGGPARHQPLDQARAERSPRVTRRVSVALGRWERELRAAPQCPYPIASNGPGGPAAAELRSEAGAMALANVADRTGLSRPTIVLAAICALLSQRTGCPAPTFIALCGNRFDRELSNYIGSLVQSVQISVEAGGASFDELARRAWRSTLQAVRYGVYNVDRRTEIADMVQWERGIRFSFEPIFNNRVADIMPVRSASLSPPKHAPSEIRRAQSRSVLDWAIRVTTDVLLLFDLHQVDGLLRLRLRTRHSDRISKVEIEQLLLAIERLLVAAAAEDLDADQIKAVLDLGSIVRDDDWIQLDECWIQVSEAQRLAEDALAPAPVRVFPLAGPRPLVGYLAGDGFIRSPEQAHAMCMAALPGRFTAMAPRYYVLCHDAPGDVTDMAAWQRQRVLAEGSGRSRELR